MKKTQRNIMPSKGPRGVIIAVGIALLGVGLLSWLISTNREIIVLTYSQFLDKVEHNEVATVRVSGQELVGISKDGHQFEAVIPETPRNWDILREHGVDIRVESTAGQYNFWYMLFLIALGFIGVMAWQFYRQARGGGGGAPGPGNLFNMGKSKAKMYPPSAIKEKFSSVAGAQEAKEELADVVDFLKNPEKYKAIGAKIPRGVLLVGEPGNGKTLLARAVAGEANCPFYSISGSDFIEVFVGVGASRVRDLFAQARSTAPCIVFIDEIDAVGRHRGRGIGGGHDEREQTLNQLLTEMDGFETYKKPVIVIAATNRDDVLDKALLRPGRFDRIVNVPFPDLKSRREILGVHAKNIKLDSSIDLDRVARGTPGFSGADIQNLLNEAAIQASKLGKALVDMHDIEEARDKMMLGKESKSKMLTPEDKKETAYHEAGHALVALLNPKHADPLHKITIIPRGRALGVAHQLPEREKYSKSKEDMETEIMVCMGGRAAEELVFNKIATGPLSDFTQATRVARGMVCYYGMSDKLGPVVYPQEYEVKPYSEETAKLIDNEVRRILTEMLEKTKDLLAKNRDKLELLAQKLIEKETLYAAEIYELLGIEPRTQHTLI
jgi:cell division protease FtsH